MMKGARYPTNFELGEETSPLQIWSLSYQRTGTIIIDMESSQFSNVADWMELYTYFQFSAITIT